MNVQTMISKKCAVSHRSRKVGNVIGIPNNLKPVSLGSKLHRLPRAPSIIFDLVMTPFSRFELMQMLDLTAAEYTQGTLNETIRRSLFSRYRKSTETAMFCFFDIVRARAILRLGQNFSSKDDDYLLSNFMDNLYTMIQDRDTDYVDLHHWDWLYCTIDLDELNEKHSSGRYSKKPIRYLTELAQSWNELYPIALNLVSSECQPRSKPRFSSNKN
jgi:hypothetical protein